MIKLSRIDNKSKNYFEIIFTYLRDYDILPTHADAIICGGEWEAVDAAECVAELYNKRHSNLVIFSGYADFEDNTTGKSEARLLSEHAIKLGVPQDKIILEEQASNTAENIIFSAKILKNMGILPQDIILVHKPSMARRFRATAEKQWPFLPHPKFYATGVQDSFQEYIERESDNHRLERTLSDILGDYKRIHEYAQNGWQSPQPFDQNAESAYQELIKLGFIPR